jgi:xanthine dehydrogenase large subunit
LVRNTKNTEQTIYRSKAVGEPPFMLGMSVFFAIKDAISSTINHTHSVLLQAPATPEEVLMAITRLKHNAGRDEVG